MHIHISFATDGRYLVKHGSADTGFQLTEAFGGGTWVGLHYGIEPAIMAAGAGGPWPYGTVHEALAALGTHLTPVAI